jgi:hypothetical protein
MKQTFNDFLEEQWADQNPEETFNDDQQDDRFYNWLVDLDFEEYIGYAEKWGLAEYRQGMLDGMDRAIAKLKE